MNESMNYYKKKIKIYLLACLKNIIERKNAHTEHTYRN